MIHLFMQFLFIFLMTFVFFVQTNASETKLSNTAIDTDTEVSSLACEQDSALSNCIKPNRPLEYYAEQSVLYFRTMESTVSPFIQPEYSEKVIRWEWPPWLWLTGYGRFNLIWTDTLLKLFPTAYDKIDCRGFEQQPFGRCHVVFNYSGRLCPIYEEFTFNSQGEITFIEAWSDFPSLLPMDADDTWAESKNVKRLANKVPGLGNGKGLIDSNAAWMIAAAQQDTDIANLRYRLNNTYTAYYDAISKHEGDLFSGCEKPKAE